MENADPQKLFEILCECFARANGLVFVSVKLKDIEPAKTDCNHEPVIA